MNKPSNRIIIILFFLVGIIGFASQVQAGVLDNLQNSLVAHYKMNDNAASTTVVDSQGYSNGTFVDATGDPNTDAHSVEGQVGTALTFDGTDDCVNTNDAFESVFRDSFTMNFWAKPDDGIPPIGVAILGAGLDSTFILGLDNAGGLGSAYDAGGEFVYANTGVVFSDGLQPWTMITVMIEIISSWTVQTRIYVNGVLEGASPPAYPLTMSDYIGSGGNLFLGCLNTHEGPMTLFDGSLDNVMIFNKALNSEEIALLYNSGNGIDTYVITGQVILYGGDSEVTDVLLTLSGNATETTNPDTEGNYSFICWEGYDYVITPSLESCHFYPASYSYTPLDSDQTEQNFIGWLRETHDSDGGGYSCCIATTAYGASMASEVKILRGFRDNYLITNPVGEGFVKTYYKVSPRAALFIKEHPMLKKAVRNALNPLIWMSRKSIK